MVSLHKYFHQFLTSPHPHREGNVCPFMSKILLNNQMQLVEYSHADNSKSLVDLVRLSIENFINQNDCIVLVGAFNASFDLEEAKRIADGFRKFVANKGYMIGAFGPTDRTPSLHSDKFFPFRTPRIILVVRIMVPHDKQFFDKAGFFMRRAMYSGYKKRYPN